MLMLLRFAYGKQKDYNSYADILEKLNELPILPEADRIASYKTLAQINAQNKNYDKAIPYAMKWADNGGGSEANTLIWQLYLIQHDCQNGMVYLEKAVAGRDATETELRQENSCYYTLGDKAKRQATMEQLVKRFMKHDYIYDLLLIYDEQKIDMRAKLNIFRLEFAKDFLTRESEFTEMAEDAIDIGSPTEALAVLNKGIERQAVKLIAPTDHPSKMLAQSKLQAAEDKKQIAALDREAQAGKNGEADVKVGLVYLGQGDNQKAADSITRGLSPERVGRVKRVDDANMMLGIAYARLGKADEARKAFTAAQADPRMANAATIWMESL
jgi:lipopolysaccharide biosynthesis regulator YciM